MAGIFVKRLLDAQNECGVTTGILTPDSDININAFDMNVVRFRYAPKALQRLAQKPGGIPQALKSHALYYLMLPVFMLALAFSIIREAKKYQIIHAHWSLCGAVALCLKFIHKRPVIMTLHGSDHKLGSKGGLYAFLHRYALRAATRVVCVSQAITNDVSSSGYAVNGVQHIANGVTQHFYDLTIKTVSAKKIRFISIGSLIALKGYEISLRSLATLPASVTWEYSIIGDGLELNRLRKMACDLGIEANVVFLGVITSAKIPELMQSHDVFILSSYTEGRPSVVLEAMASSMAVVASDIPGTRELVQHGETGWLFDLAKGRSLDKILKDISVGKLDYRLAGSNGRAWMISQKLTWVRTAEQYIELYRTVLRA